MKFRHPWGEVTGSSYPQQCRPTVYLLLKVVRSHLNQQDLGSPTVMVWSGWFNSSNLWREHTDVDVEMLRCLYRERSEGMLMLVVLVLAARPGLACLVDIEG